MSFIAEGVRPYESYETMKKSFEDITTKDDVKFDILEEVKNDRMQFVDLIFSKIDMESILKAHRNFVDIINDMADKVYNYFARIRKIYLSIDICRDISLLLFDISLDNVEIK